MNKWYFPLSNNGLKRGLKDSGIETFKGQILASLSREIIQNSLDAKKKDDHFVKIEFKYFLLNRHNFPDKETFVDNLNASLQETKILQDQSSANFFKSAIKQMNDDYIPFVRISDFNTNGLTGSSENGPSDWNNLVRSTGISDKGEEAGGSFGIGKNAPFACSNLHTVFYSTLDQYGVEAYQGVSNLITVYKPEKDDYTQGIGYYASNEKNEKIDAQARFDESFLRKESGTDIYIAGFKFEKNEFETQILKGVLDNFLYAIHQETLIVEINGQTINKESLNQIVGLNKSYLEIETIELLELLNSTETLWFDDFRGGQAKLGLLIDEQGSKRISAIRKPWMKIRYFDGFSKTVDFKGTFIVQGKEVNKLLRKMENPQHDKWETDRLNEIDKKHGQRLLQEIRKHINDKILSLNSTDSLESLELIGADEYIQLIEDESNKKTKKVKEKVSSVEVKKDTRVLSTQEIETYGDFEAYLEDGDEESLYDKPVHINDVPVNPTPDDTVLKAKTGRKVSINRNQIKIARISKNGDYKLFYKSEKDKSKVNISIFPLDEEGKKILGVVKIVEAKNNGKDLQINQNVIEGIIVEGTILNLYFKIDSKESYSLGVDIHEID